MNYLKSAFICFLLSTPSLHAKELEFSFDPDVLIGSMMHQDVLAGYEGQLTIHNARIYNEFNVSVLIKKKGFELPEEAKLTLQTSPPSITVNIPDLAHNDEMLLTAIMESLVIKEKQVEIYAAFIGFSKKLLDELPDQDFPGLPDTEQLIQLAKQGKGEIYARFKLNTINGVNAVAEDVEELIYPTEFDVAEHDISMGVSSGSDGINEWPFFPDTVIPGAFETREVGAILNITPTIQSDNQFVNLTMLPEFAQLKGWEEYGGEFTDGKDRRYAAQMRQPIFKSMNITTSITVHSGETIVQGGGVHDPDTDHILFFFVRATILD